MDSNIATAVAEHGNIWNLDVNRHMESLYEPLQAARKVMLDGKVQIEKDIRYGPSARHRIELYGPMGTSQNLLPVVVFLHGGGFTAGDIHISPSMHGNIGRFFAVNNCICALTTYRLVTEARYPSGGEDITAALKWLHTNVRDFGGDPARIIALGQSAGGAHLANALFSGMLKTSAVPLAGCVLFSAPLWYNLGQARRKANMLLYHETTSEEEVLKRTGVEVFKAASPEDVAQWTLLLLVAEYDPDEIIDGNMMFVNEYRAKMKKMPILEIMKGHNHISYTLGMGLERDYLGKRLLEFVNVARAT